MSSRREFLAAGAAAAWLGRDARWLRPADKVPVVGIQLYTVRNELAKDPEGTLTRLAEIGYKEVEFAGYPGTSTASLRAMLDRLHLKAPSSHVNFSAIRSDWNKRLDDAVTMGQRFIVVASLGSEPDGTPDDWKRIAHLLNTAGEQAQAKGIQLAYHNHDFEFTRLGGQMAYEILLRESDPKLLKLEADLYWMTKAGQDPVAYFQQWPGRFPLLHIKDMDATPKRGFAPLGQGTIDFRRILAHRKQAGVQHFFYEQDSVNGSVFDAARTSLAYLRDLRF